MAIKKAQKLVNKIYDETGISLVNYHVSDLEYLRDGLNSFLELEVDTEELEDPSDASDDYPAFDEQDDEEE